jgi:hypothetical protein
MSNPEHNPDLDKVKYLLTLVRNSCEEALDGSWDHTTSEGQEAFRPMSEDIEEAARELGIDLDPYQPRNDGGDDEEN